MILVLKGHPRASGAMMGPQILGSREQSPQGPSFAPQGFPPPALRHLTV